MNEKSSRWHLRKVIKYQISLNHQISCGKDGTTIKKTPSGKDNGLAFFSEDLDDDGREN
jgi:hypothetical protein